MKKIILLVVIIANALLCDAQSSSKYPTVGDMKGLYRFNKCCMYDIDLQRQYNLSRCEAIVSFNLDATGQGTLSFFVVEKKKYAILQCYKVENEYQFNLQRDNGKIILGILKVDAKNVVESFWLFEKPDVAIITFLE